jgi:hypothetical protein
MAKDEDAFEGRMSWYGNVTTIERPPASWWKRRIVWPVQNVFDRVRWWLEDRRAAP